MTQDLQFGVSLTPIVDVVGNRLFAQAAEAGGLDLIGIQDHPYVPDYLDTFVLAGDLLAATRKIAVFPDVANLPLRPPALLAKTAAALDLVSGGRFELALGLGGYWDAITRLGVPRRTPREAMVSLEEAITLLRALWAEGGAPVQFDGELYSVSGVHPGPAPAHPIEIWTGSQGPKSLALTGRIADGWSAPSPQSPAACGPRRATTLSEAPPSSGRTCWRTWAPSSRSPPSSSGRRHSPSTRSPPSPVKWCPRSEGCWAPGTPDGRPTRILPASQRKESP